MNYIRNKSNILNDKKTDPKKYWTILNYFLNNIKIPSIPPLFSNGKTITNVVEKANLFNDFFAAQCTPLENTSTLPPFFRKTCKTISKINFNGDDIICIIKSLDSKKAHGVDNISIRMIKLCGNSIIYPLTLIFEDCIAKGIFPDLWKLANVIPAYKKESKNIVKNYRPISLLPIFAKIFERLLYNSLFFHFYENELFTECQSGFLPGDSCVSQLLSIVHEIQSSFDSSLEVGAVFLDISKAFDKVWHPGLLFKLKSYGIEGKLLNLLENYLHNRKQRVVLDGQCSSWKNILSGVPQGSVLGPLLFLIYINDLPDGICSLCKIFADDTSIFSKVHNKYLCQTNLNNDLSNIKEWAFQWKMQFNPDPNKQANEVYFSKKITSHDILPIKFNNNPVQLCNSQKHLGLILDKQLNFNEHIDKKIKVCNKLIGSIKCLSSILPRKSLLTIYKSFVRPQLDYGDIIYDNPANESFINIVEKVQYKACLAITGAIHGTSRESLYKEFGLESLRFRRWYRKMIFFYRIVNELTPKYLTDIIPKTNCHYGTRSKTNSEINQFYTRTESFKNSFFPYCIKEWNKLDVKIRNLSSLSKFKKALLAPVKTDENSLFGIHDPAGVKLLNRLRLNFSHLNEHKFRHGFRDTLNPICECNSEVETTSHYLLRCHLFSTQRSKLLDNINQLDNTILTLSDKEITNILLFGSPTFSFFINNNVLAVTIDFLKSTNRFNKALF